MKCGNFKGGGGKGRSGGGSDTITKTRERKTSAIDDTIMSLRNALFNDDGKDKDVCEGIMPMLMSYKKNGLDIEFQFKTGNNLTKKEREWAYDLTKEHMEDVYDASGYGWDDDEKARDFKDNAARFIIARNKEDGLPIGICHFRFTVQGEIMEQMTGAGCVYVWDLQIEDAYQRKGLGKAMLLLMELIAGRQKMSYVSFPTQLGDECAINFIGKCKGYIPDVYLETLLGFVPEEEGFVVYSKPIGAARAAASAPAVAVPTVFDFKAPSPSTPEKAPAPVTEVQGSPTSIVDEVAPSDANSKPAPVVEDFAAAMARLSMGK